MKLSLCSLGLALALFVPTVAGAQTTGGWTNTVNVATGDGSLTKNAGCNLCPDAGATSAARITGDGYVEFVPAYGHRLTAGLSTDLSASTAIASMDYAFSVWPDGSWDIREKGVYRGEGKFTAGDRLRISVEAGAVVYRRNGVPVHVSLAPPAFPMAFDVTFYSSGASLTRAAVADQAPLAWTDVTNASVSRGDLSKTGGCKDCPDAGAHSVSRLIGNGYIDLTPTPGHRITAGLSADLSSSTGMMSMDYAFSFWPDGAWDIRERGVYRGEGTFAAGDRFRISVSGGTVTYLRNGVVLRTSDVVPAFPMVLDATLTTPGATIYEAALVNLRTPITWTFPVKVIAQPGSLTKSGGCEGCPDSGARSTALIEGGGYAEFVAPGGHRITAGLSTDLSAATGATSMNYAFNLWPGGSWDIREFGTYKTEGSFTAGDRFRLAIEAGQVKYYRNGAVVYTSLVPPSAPLTFDVTLLSVGASLADAAVGSGPSNGAPSTTTPPPPPPAPAPAPEPVHHHHHHHHHRHHRRRQA